jgi:hypothetical protein|tara:strand:+ start:317 stop:1246 length:930 start_codon:yes stop_codon:yes gene_type:complete
MKVVAYHSGIPPKNNSPEKPLILSNFIQGVVQLGNIGTNHYQPTLQDCDLAVLQGFVHANSKNTPHLLFRRQVIDRQKLTKAHTLIVDSNLFLFQTASKRNTPGNYLRYSLDGVFRDTGFYFDKDIDPNRWLIIKKHLAIDVKSYDTRGNFILLCLQRNGGWSMKHQDVIEYAHRTIRQLKSVTSRKIIVRGHPGDRKTMARIAQEIKYPNVEISSNPDIRDDLKNAWASVTFNSSPGVASLIHGVPVFQMDQDLNYSMYSEVANTDLTQIENPILFDRQEWLERIAMCHWSFDELTNGTAWKFMRKYI